MEPSADQGVDAVPHEHADADLRKRRRLPRALFPSENSKNLGFIHFPLLFALGLCTGAGWYSLAWAEPDIAPLITFLAVSIASLLIFRRFFALPEYILAIILVLTGASTGAAAGKLAQIRVSHPIIEQVMGPVMLEGWVEEVEPAKRGVRLRLAVHAIDDLPRHALPERVRVTHTTRLEVDAGRFVRCWAVLRPPPGPIIRGDYAFDRQAYFEGLGAVGYVQGRCRGGTLGAPQDWRRSLRLTIAKYRRSLAFYVRDASGDRAGGFAAALATGDRSFMASADQDALRGSGLAHLLAISGLHMGIVGGLIYLIVWRSLAFIEPLALRVPVQKPAAIAALVASTVYLILSGASVSTQRAFIMAAVLFGAVLFDRTSLSLRSLAIAMIIVAIMAPWSVLTPGFQMSFAATGALIATYEAWQRRDRLSGARRRRGVGFWFKSLVVTSFVSGTATMPFALYHFDRVAGLGFIANLFAMPVISLITAPLSAVALILSPFGLSDLPLRLFGTSLEAVLWVAHTFTDLAPAGASPGKPMPGLSLILFSGALILACMLKGWQKRAVFASVTTAAGIAYWVIVPASALHWAPSGDVFIVQSSGQAERIEFADGDGLSPLRYADHAASADCSQSNCLRLASDLRLQLIPDLRTAKCSDLEQTDQILTLTTLAAPAYCNVPVISWSDINMTGGNSWSVEADRLTPIIRQPCGSRAWNPCAPEP